MTTIANGKKSDGKKMDVKKSDGVKNDKKITVVDGGKKPEIKTPNVETKKPDVKKPDVNKSVVGDKILTTNVDGKMLGVEKIETIPKKSDVVISLLTPVDLAKQFECDSKKIRVILRKHKIQKNDDGKYGWSKTKYDEISKIVKTEIDIQNKKWIDPTK